MEEKQVWYTRKKYRRYFFLVLFVCIGVVLYFTAFRTITINPLTERAQMEQLEETKKQHELSLFTTDGCSGNVSDGWRQAVEQFSEVSESFKIRFSDVSTVPFEAACIEHDRVYHSGEGGYRARLRADNTLRESILKYALDNTDEIKEYTGFTTDEEVLFLFELTADAIYRGVRLGGAPCTGMHYAWGYGYNNGSCEQ